MKQQAKLPISSSAERSSSCLFNLHPIYTVSVYLNFNSSAEISHLYYIHSHKENQFAPSCTTEWLHFPRIQAQQRGVCLLLCASVSMMVLEETSCFKTVLSSNKGSISSPKLLTVMKDTLAVWLVKPRDVKLGAFQTDCSVQFHEA